MTIPGVYAKDIEDDRLVIVPKEIVPKEIVPMEDENMGHWWWGSDKTLGKFWSKYYGEEAEEGFVIMSTAQVDESLEIPWEFL